MQRRGNAGVESQTGSAAESLREVTDAALASRKNAYDVYAETQARFKRWFLEQYDAIGAIVDEEPGERPSMYARFVLSNRIALQAAGVQEETVAAQAPELQRAPSSTLRRVDGRVDYLRVTRARHAAERATHYHGALAGITSPAAASQSQVREDMRRRIRYLRATAASSPSATLAMSGKPAEEPGPAADRSTASPVGGGSASPAAFSWDFTAQGGGRRRGLEPRGGAASHAPPAPASPGAASPTRPQPFTFHLAYQLAKQTSERARAQANGTFGDHHDAYDPRRQTLVGVGPGDERPVLPGTGQVLVTVDERPSSLTAKLLGVPPPLGTARLLRRRLAVMRAAAAREAVGALPTAVDIADAAAADSLAGDVQQRHLRAVFKRCERAAAELEGRAVPSSEPAAAALPSYDSEALPPVGSATYSAFAPSHVDAAAQGDPLHKLLSLGHLDSAVQEALAAFFTDPRSGSLAAYDSAVWHHLVQSLARYVSNPEGASRLMQRVNIVGGQTDAVPLREGLAAAASTVSRLGPSRDGSLASSLGAMSEGRLRAALAQATAAEREEGGASPPPPDSPQETPGAQAGAPGEAVSPSVTKGPAVFGFDLPRAVSLRELVESASQTALRHTVAALPPQARVAAREAWSTFADPEEDLTMAGLVAAAAAAEGGGGRSLAPSASASSLRVQATVLDAVLARRQELEAQRVARRHARLLEILTTRHEVNVEALVRQRETQLLRKYHPVARAAARAAAERIATRAQHLKARHGWGVLAGVRVAVRRMRALLGDAAVRQDLVLAVAPNGRILPLQELACLAAAAGAVVPSRVDADGVLVDARQPGRYHTGAVVQGAGGVSDKVGAATGRSVPDVPQEYLPHGYVVRDPEDYGRAVVTAAGVRLPHQAPEGTLDLHLAGLHPSQTPQPHHALLLAGYVARRAADPPIVSTRPPGDDMTQDGIGVWPEESRVMLGPFAADHARGALPRGRNVLKYRPSIDADGDLRTPDWFLREWGDPPAGSAVMVPTGGPDEPWRVLRLPIGDGDLNAPRNKSSQLKAIRDTISFKPGDPMGDVYPLDALGGGEAGVVGLRLAMRAAGEAAAQFMQGTHVPWRQGRAVLTRKHLEGLNTSREVMAGVARGHIPPVGHALHPIPRPLRPLLVIEPLDFANDWGYLLLTSLRRGVDMYTDARGRIIPAAADAGVPLQAGTAFRPGAVGAADRPSSAVNAAHSTGTARARGGAVLPPVTDLYNSVYDALRREMAQFLDKEVAANRRRLRRQSSRRMRRGRTGSFRSMGGGARTGSFRSPTGGKPPLTSTSHAPTSPPAQAPTSPPRRRSSWGTKVSTSMDSSGEEEEEGWGVASATGTTGLGPTLISPSSGRAQPLPAQFTARVAANSALANAWLMKDSAYEGYALQRAQAAAAAAEATTSWTLSPRAGTPTSTAQTPDGASPAAGAFPLTSPAPSVSPITPLQAGDVAVPLSVSLDSSHGGGAVRHTRGHAMPPPTLFVPGSGAAQGFSQAPDALTWETRPDAAARRATQLRVAGLVAGREHSDSDGGRSPQQDDASDGSVSSASSAALEPGAGVGDMPPPPLAAEQHGAFHIEPSHGALETVEVAGSPHDEDDTSRILGALGVSQGTPLPQPARTSAPTRPRSGRRSGRMGLRRRSSRRMSARRPRSARTAPSLPPMQEEEALSWMRQWLDVAAAGLQGVAGADILPGGVHHRTQGGGGLVDLSVMHPALLERMGMGQYVQALAQEGVQFRPRPPPIVLQGGVYEPDRPPTPPPPTITVKPEHAEEGAGDTATAEAKLFPGTPPLTPLVPPSPGSVAESLAYSSASEGSLRSERGSAARHHMTTPPPIALPLDAVADGLSGRPSAATLQYASGVVPQEAPSPPPPESPRSPSAEVRESTLPSPAPESSPAEGGQAPGKAAKPPTPRTRPLVPAWATQEGGVTLHRTASAPPTEGLAWRWQLSKALQLYAVPGQAPGVPWDDAALDMPRVHSDGSIMSHPLQVGGAPTEGTDTGLGSRRVESPPHSPGQGAGGGARAGALASWASASGASFFTQDHLPLLLRVPAHTHLPLPGSSAPDDGEVEAALSNRPHSAGATTTRAFLTRPATTRGQGRSSWVVRGFGPRVLHEAARMHRSTSLHRAASLPDLTPPARLLTERSGSRQGAVPPDLQELLATMLAAQGVPGQSLQVCLRSDVTFHHPVPQPSPAPAPPASPFAASEPVHLPLATRDAPAPAPVPAPAIASARTPATPTAFADRAELRRIPSSTAESLEEGQEGPGSVAQWGRSGYSPSSTSSLAGAGGEARTTPSELLVREPADPRLATHTAAAARPHRPREAPARPRPRKYTLAPEVAPCPPRQPKVLLQDLASGLDATSPAPPVDSDPTPALPPVLSQAQWMWMQPELQRQYLLQAVAELDAQALPPAPGGVTRDMLPFLRRALSQQIIARETILMRLRTYLRGVPAVGMHFRQFVAMFEPDAALASTVLDPSGASHTADASPEPPLLDTVREYLAAQELGGVQLGRGQHPQHSVAAAPARQSQAPMSQHVYAASHPVMHRMLTHLHATGLAIGRLIARVRQRALARASQDAGALPTAEAAPGGAEAERALAATATAMAQSMLPPPDAAAHLVSFAEGAAEPWFACEPYVDKMRRDAADAFYVAETQRIMRGKGQPPRKASAIGALASAPSFARDTEQPAHDNALEVLTITGLQGSATVRYESAVGGLDPMGGEVAEAQRGVRQRGGPLPPPEARGLLRPTVVAPPREGELSAKLSLDLDVAPPVPPHPRGGEAGSVTWVAEEGGEALVRPTPTMYTRRTPSAASPSHSAAGRRGGGRFQDLRKHIYQRRSQTNLHSATAGAGPHHHLVHHRRRQDPEADAAPAPEQTPSPHDAAWIAAENAKADVFGEEGRGGTAVLAQPRGSAASSPDAAPPPTPLVPAHVYMTEADTAPAQAEDSTLAYVPSGVDMPVLLPSQVAGARRGRPASAQGRLRTAPPAPAPHSHAKFIVSTPNTLARLKAQQQAQAQPPSQHGQAPSAGTGRTPALDRPASARARYKANEAAREAAQESLAMAGAKLLARQRAQARRRARPASGRRRAKSRRSKAAAEARAVPEPDVDFTGLGLSASVQQLLADPQAVGGEEHGLLWDDAESAAPDPVPEEPDGSQVATARHRLRAAVQGAPPPQKPPPMVRRGADKRGARRLVKALVGLH